MLFYLPEIFTLLGIALVFIILRVISRWTSVGPRQFAPDDYLMPLVGVVFTLEVLLAYPFGYMVKGLANDGIPPEYRAALDPAGEEYRLRVTGSKVQLIGWCLYTLILWLLKLCMCFFYFRLTDGLFDVANQVKIALGVVGTTYVATLLSILVGCTPFQKNWQINPDPGNRCQPGVSKVNVYVVMILNILTDLHLMSIVLPLFWKAKIHMRRKIVLLIMFSGAIFIIAASIVRGVTILNSNGDGSLQGGLWACRESFVAIAIGNIPMIYPVVRRMLRHTAVAKLFPSMVKSSNGNGARSSYIADQQRSKSAPWRTLQDDTAYDSQERIMLETQITVSNTKDDQMSSETSGTRAPRGMYGA